MGRILVVDDDVGWRALYRFALGAAHEVSEAGDPREALEQVERQTPDLLVLDYHLPVMSGVALLALLRRAGLRAPVILCTADPWEVPLGDYDAVVPKSTDLGPLRHTIEELLGARGSRDSERAA